MEDKIKLVECPRDAMQGWPHFIPTKQKVDYLNALLRVGFDTLDFGSFVSPKAIPQMADTEEVLKELDTTGTATSLLAIVANTRGAAKAVEFENIAYLGYPFSISETFQQRNTNASIEDSLITVRQMQELCVQHGKKMVVYLSMGFGNPYNDPFHADILLGWMEKLVREEIGILSVADTVGLATAEEVSTVMQAVMSVFPQHEIGVHLHSTAANRLDKLNAALEAGVRRFDGAIKGIGGCPMAGDQLVGNMDTEVMISHLENIGYALPIDKQALRNAVRMSAEVFI
jgi:hydroxymethylglutaryl-CoA lyase